MRISLKANMGQLERIRLEVGVSLLVGWCDPCLAILLQQVLEDF